MADTTGPNYPDVLGYITGGARCNVGVAQVALAVRPRVVRAGRPFEAILLIQNASDGDIDVTASLSIPEQDAKRQKGRFVATKARLVVGLRPAEAGYVTLPILSLPDTAVGDNYKVSMGVEVKALDKPKRIRQPEGGAGLALEYLPEAAVSRLNDLKKLTYYATKRGLMGTTLEAPFNVLSAQVAPLTDFKPGWVSLWRMSDYRDDRLLLARYASALENKVLPRLRREHLYKPLFETTRQRFKAAGYDLQPIEAHYIAKLLVAVLEMAKPQEKTFDYLGGEQFNVQAVIEKGAAAGVNGLPRWCRALLKAIDEDPASADEPEKLLAGALYDELLRDAIPHAFAMLHAVTGEEMGSDDDIQTYTERLAGALVRPGATLTFLDAYLPLLMAGVIYYDRAVMADEQLGEALTAAANQLITRHPEIGETGETVYQMAEQIMDNALFKFGYRA